MNKQLLASVIIITVIIAGLATWVALTPKTPPAPDKTELIRLNSPKPGATISSPLHISGEARGNWFFEANFPVFLTDWDGKIIAQGIATAKGDWMTTEFVPFEATLTFSVDPNVAYNRGALILKKDNPSGLPENDDALEVQIFYAGVPATNSVACTQEAKLCPDGTSVSRTGPNCSFAPCPNPNPTSIAPFNSGVRGQVLLGPTCPVERNPPDPKCADKPYQTTIQIFTKNSSSGNPFATVETAKDGTYTIALPPGEYTLQASGGKVLPRCSSESVTIKPDQMTVVNVSCDSGIR